MKKEKPKMKHGLALFFCVSLCFIFLSSRTTPLHAQEPVAPVTEWMATVDSATQQIMLRWNPSATSATMGYHICTGTPCLDYDTVFGRLNTSYICVDHSPLERHTYRLHVFDSSFNVSSLTPSFGNVVLEAEVPECETTVRCHWTPYEGNPQPLGHEKPFYQVEILREPLDTAFHDFTGRSDGEPLECTFDLPESVTRVWLRVVVGIPDLSTTIDDYFHFQPESNIVMVERRTIDTASVVEISGIEYDSIHTVINLTCEVDTAFEYTLYRSIDGTPWREMITFQPKQSQFHYTDRDINPFDSLHCYMLKVFDACGLNPRYSNTAWVVIPNPISPAIAIPNTVIVGDPANGTFLPVVCGLKGDLYELFIYTRDGLLVYSTEDHSAGWTPAANTPQGAYAYYLRCRFNDNRIKIYTGSLLVIK